MSMWESSLLVPVPIFWCVTGHVLRVLYSYCFLHPYVRLPRQRKRAVENFAWLYDNVRHPQKVIETRENCRVSRGVPLKLFEQLEGKGYRGKSKQNKVRQAQ
ncbi:hypothetical protein HOY82DRAFT_550816 [Tuber indicum]|nr:hypothetical protein HOY82DRAFT_550816 [Tuber indicum]